MSLPPALLKRLASRGLLPKEKKQKNRAPAENEEVIAEDYDDVQDTEQQQQLEEEPSQYDYDVGNSFTKRHDDNFWLERIKARMNEASSYTGFKGCPNKYNIWHRCTVYCVNRWSEGRPEPNASYLRRYNRLVKKYPLPKGWKEVYDSGCGCFYFYSATEKLVSWLPPTHPKSQVTKSAAVIRRRMDTRDARAETGNLGFDGRSSGDSDDDDDDEEAKRQLQEIDDIINSSFRTRSPTAEMTKPKDQGENPESIPMPPFKRTPRREKGSRRHGGRDDINDPMDPSSYSDAPPGKWSDGLQQGSGERSKHADNDE